MKEALGTLDRGWKKNAHVRLSTKAGGWITLSPLEALPSPPNLTAFKTELFSQWPMTSLLDIVKETDLRLGFTEALKSPTAYETLDRSMGAVVTPLAPATKTGLPKSRQRATKLPF